LVAGQVKPPLDGRERLVALEPGFVPDELIEQRLAVQEVLQLQLLEPWYFSFSYGTFFGLASFPFYRILFEQVFD
jgi:hypothetical protein